MIKILVLFYTTIFRKAQHLNASTSPRNPVRVCKKAVAKLETGKLEPFPGATFQSYAQQCDESRTKARTEVVVRKLEAH